MNFFFVFFTCFNQASFLLRCKFSTKILAKTGHLIGTSLNKIRNIKNRKIEKNGNIENNIENRLMSVENRLRVYDFRNRKHAT
jgi:hypothetical protein